MVWEGGAARLLPIPIRFHCRSRKLDTIHAEIENFQNIVPFADEATMVLKAHLLLEQSLWKFISARLSNDDLVTALRCKESEVRNGKALIQLAEAIAARDEVPIDNGEKLWPALYAVNSLRNSLAHEIEPDRKKIEKYMRKVANTVCGEVTDNLNRDFYWAAILLLGYLGISREALDVSDLE